MKRLKDIFKLGIVLLPAILVSPNAHAGSSEAATADYNGTYMGRYVISKYLANFCEIPDDVIVGKIDVLKNCMDKLAAKMRSQSAQIAEEGKKDWGSALSDTWNMALTQAGTVLANKQNYEDDYNSLWQSSEKTGDQHADQAAIANATEKQMAPFLALLSMHAEKLKADALSNLPNVNPELLYVTPASGQKENVDYKGTKEDIQVVPNALAIYCEMNGEDFVAEEKKDAVKKCLDTIVAKLNDKSSEERKQASDDYSIIISEQAQTLMMQAVNKSAGNVEYDKARKAQATANSQTQTDFETTSSHAFASTLQLQAINDFRTFFASGMKYIALGNLSNVDAAAVIEDMANDVNKDVKVDDFAAGNQVEDVNVTVDAGEVKEVDPNASDEDEADIGYDDGNDAPSGSSDVPVSADMLDNPGEGGGDAAPSPSPSPNSNPDNNGGKKSEYDSGDNNSKAKDPNVNTRVNHTDFGDAYIVEIGDQSASPHTISMLYNGEEFVFVERTDKGLKYLNDKDEINKFYEYYTRNETNPEVLRKMQKAYQEYMNK